MSNQAQDTKYASPTGSSSSNQSRPSNDPKSTKADQSSQQKGGSMKNEPQSSDRKTSNY